MLKKYIVLGLMMMTFNLSMSVVAFAETKEEKAAKVAAKVKANIAKLGTGKDARVEVRLKDGTKLKGYVDRIDESSFVVMNEKTGVATNVAYSQTKQVKGNNLSTGVKIALGILIFVAVFTIIGLAQ